MNTFARIESVCTFKDGLSFLIKSISLIRQSNLLEHLPWEWCHDDAETSAFNIIIIIISISFVMGKVEHLRSKITNKDT